MDEKTQAEAVQTELTMDDQQNGTDAAVEAPAVKDYMDWYKECAARVDQTTYWAQRGIGVERPDILKKFWLGYDPAYKAKEDSKYLNDVVVIPTSRTTYVCRNTKPGTEYRFFKAPDTVPVLFNTKAIRKTDTPLIVTEAEIDALSVLEVGGNALGLGGTGNWKLFVELIKETRPRQLIVLALDNDDAGDKAAANIINALKDEPVKIYNRDKFTNGIYGPHKDANEILVADRPGLKAAIKEILDIEEKEIQAAAEAYRDKYSTAAYMDEFKNRIIDSINTPAVPTGYEKFDVALDGGLYPELYIVGALSSLGKTTYILQMADQIAAQGHDVIIFSLEMARSELIAKSISRQTFLEVIEEGLDTDAAKTVRGITDFARYEHYSAEECEVINNSIERYEKLARHVFIVEALGDIGVKEIRETVDEIRRATHSAPVVFVDYLQIIKAAEPRADIRANTDANVKALKQMSRDLNIPVVAVSSINRDNYKNEMNMASFKESGGIEYGAGVLLGLQLKGVGGEDFNVEEAKKKEPREIELKILKNRNGATGITIEYRYYPKFNYIMECGKTIGDGQTDEWLTF
jgi:replicative DNA helicase